MKKLYFFTTHYPQKDFQWKTDELKMLSKNFNVEVIPYIQESFDFQAPRFDNVFYQAPLIEKKLKSPLIKTIIKASFNKNTLKFYKEFFGRRVFLSKTKIILWAEATQKIIELSRNQRLREIFKEADDNTILYFYWGRETSEGLGFLPKTKGKTIIRLHGYDLYEYRHKGDYIAFRTVQLNNLDYAIFISENGKEYLMNRYPQIKFEAKIFRLGTTSQGLARQSTDNIFRIISCSSVIPLKRVDLIAEALKLLKIEIEWTHIGGGNDNRTLENAVLELPENIKFTLAGQVAAKDVPNFYVKKPVDLFINVSQTEGLPVSIMEAFAAGIPALATKVGGTNELVNDKTGILLLPNPTPKEIAKAISDFYNMSTREKKQFRINAFERYEEIACFRKNIPQYTEFLRSL